VKKATAVFVPGLRDHVAAHWQTLLQARLPGSVCVPRLGKDNLALHEWIEALDITIASVGGPVVLVAHSAGVMMVAHWALSRMGPVRAALLAAPPDFEAGLPAGYPSREALAQNGWMPAPRALLPFRSIVVGSTNDPLATLERAAAFARDWGSELVDAGAVGHLNPAAGFGEWPQAVDLLGELGLEVEASAAIA
jgi:predicted alpha/beta hydrolase family esterase